MLILKMTAAEILFWVSLGVLFYCYIGYGILLFTLNNIRRLFRPRHEKTGAELLPVTLIVAAYNEEEILPQKIRNTIELDYPSHLFNIIFITDGSTDNSAELL